MNASSVARFLFVFLCFLCKIRGVSAQICYTSGGIAGIVIATIVATVVAGIIALLVYWLIWRPHQKGKACNKLDVVEEGPDKFAYDNPYFQEDETEKHNSIRRDDSELSIKKDPAMQIDGSEKSDKLKNGKVNPLSNLVFTNNSNSKPRSLDDAFISLEPEIMSVPLRGHDFTGLGFNITGNMRDGIFVKDVLHRGPASESGQVKTGDRILSVTISFSSMVYEDALTILSYASPYDVSLELKKFGRSNLAGHEKKASMSSNDVMTVGAGNGLSSDRLYHPLYRSQSIDDLTQIGKEQMTGGMAMNGGIPPKRSLSIGAPVHRMRREQMQTREKPSPASNDVKTVDVKTDPKNADSSIDARMSSRNSSISSKSSKKSKESDSSADVIIVIDKDVDPDQGKGENDTTVVELTGDPVVIVTTETNTQIVDNPNDTTIEIVTEDEVGDKLADTLDEVETPSDKEQADKKSRKKCKAPAPPGLIAEKVKDGSSTSSSSEDEGESYKDAHDLTNTDDPSLVTAHDGSFELDSLEKTEYHPSISRLSSKSSVSDDSLDDNDPHKGKNSRKSSSLGDISKAEEVVSGTDSLERAVSLDLQKESVPVDGQLSEQNKHLKRKAPNPPSNTSSEDTLPSDQQLDDADIPEELIFKASVAIVETDSLERIPSSNEEDSKDPDSLEINTQPCDVEITATSTTYVIPTNAVTDSVSSSPGRKHSTSSSASSEPAEEIEETITKVKVSVPASILDIKEDSDSEVEIPVKAPSRKSSTSSSSSSSSSEKEEISRKSSSTSSVDVEEPIVKSARKPVEVEFALKRESSDSELEKEDETPEKKLIPLEIGLNLEANMSESSTESEGSTTEYHITETPPASPKEKDALVSSTPLIPDKKPPNFESLIKNGSDSPSISIPIIPPIITTATNKMPPAENPPSTEVIEISQQELDDVMMTHQQFIKKKASQQQKEVNTTKNDDNDISFEDWSVMSNKSNDSNNVNGNTTYSSSYETNISIDGSSSQPETVTPSSFTVMPAEGAISKTVVITNSTLKGGDIVKIVTGSEVEDQQGDPVPELTTVE